MTTRAIFRLGHSVFYDDGLSTCVHADMAAHAGVVWQNHDLFRTVAVRVQDFERVIGYAFLICFSDYSDRDILARRAISAFHDIRPIWDALDPVGLQALIHERLKAPERFDEGELQIFMDQQSRRLAALGLDGVPLIRRRAPERPRLLIDRRDDG